jgi:hypothetical protein
LLPLLLALYGIAELLVVVLGPILSNSPPSARGDDRQCPVFVTTHWSVVLAAARSDTTTAQAALEYMTEAERRKTSERLGIFGLCFVAPLAVAPSLAILFSGPSRLIEPIIFVPIALLLSLLWWKRQRRFLCSTAWAKAQGWRPERLPLFSFRIPDAPQVVVLLFLLAVVAVLSVWFMRASSPRLP